MKRLDLFLGLRVVDDILARWQVRELADLAKELLHLAGGDCLLGYREVVAFSLMLSSARTASADTPTFATALRNRSSVTPNTFIQ